MNVNVDEFKKICINHIKSGKASSEFEEFAGNAFLHVWEYSYYDAEAIIDEIESIEKEYIDSENYKSKS